MKHCLNLILFSLLTTFSVQLLHAGETSSNTGKNLFTDSAEEEEFLPPDVAFKLDLVALDASNLSANFKVVPGYYVYKQSVKFVMEDAVTGKIDAIELPTGEIKDDPNFGKQEVYHHDFVANIKLGAAWAYSR